MISRLRKKDKPEPSENLGITDPEEITRKQIARIVAGEMKGAPRIPMVIEFTDGSFSTVYLARETDEDWAEFHLMFHKAWTDSRSSKTVKRTFSHLFYLLGEWGIDMMDYHSPLATATFIRFMANRKSKDI